MDILMRLLLISLTLIFVTSCGGGGTGTATPAITSFNSSSATIYAGRSVNLTVVFANGTGSIDNGVGKVTSATPVSVTPASTTTYTLTVTNAAGTSVTSTITVTVMPLSFSTVQISWNANPETAVNQSGGGYKVYYSSNSGFNISDGGVTEIDVPYSSGATAPTLTQVQFLPGTYYIRIIAYSVLNAPGTSGGSTSTATPQTILIVS